MAPMIMFKRESFSKNRDLGNKLDGNTANLYQIFEKKYTSTNRYDRFSILTNTIPVKEFIATVVPDYITIIYSFVVFTEYVEQMNHILESINYASDSYWGDIKRFKFKARIDDFSNIVQFTVGEDRAVKSTFNIILNGYIIPESINKELSAIKKIYSKSQINFTLETTAGPLDTLQTSKTLNTTSLIGTTSIDSYNLNVISTSTITSVDLYTYLNTNQEFTAVTTTITTAVFNAIWMSAPSPLPPTSILNFEFFANGQYIEKTAILSFIYNNDGTSTLTVIASEIGFPLTGKEIVVLGKFL